MHQLIYCKQRKYHLSYYYETNTGFVLLLCARLWNATSSKHLKPLVDCWLSMIKLQSIQCIYIYMYVHLE